MCARVRKKRQRENTGRLAFFPPKGAARLAPKESMVLKKSTSQHRYGIVFTLAILFFLLSQFHLVDFQESNALDFRFLIRGIQKAHPDIVIVEIDDPSIQAVGQWPWPRGIHAVLLDLLKQYNPRAIYFDVLFTEPSPTPAEDEKLAYALEKSVNLVLPFYYYSVKPFGAFFPISLFRESVRGIGFATIDPEPDGHVRRMRISVESPGQIYYSAPVMTYLAQFVDEERAKGWISGIPHDRKNSFLINFPGPMDSFQRISFREVINSAGTEYEKRIKALFSGRIVLVGLTGTGSTTDLKPAPFSKAYPGIGIVASSLHTLLTGRYLLPSNILINLLLFILLALFAAWIAETRPPKRGLVMVCELMLVYALLNYVLFVFLGWIWPLVAVLIVIGVSYGLMLFMKFIEVYLEGELLSRELSTAARIQETFLPRVYPETEKLDVAFECRFAKRVGGDLYDWTDLEDGRIGICVGDVSGKGVPAAIYMARTISDFRRESKAGVKPEDVFDALNKVLSCNGSAGMFVTMVYAVVDTGEKKITVCNAGHENIILYRHGQIRAEMEETVKSPPLGIFEDVCFQSVEIPFKEGDLLLLWSDGVKELRNPKGEEFGTERIRGLVEEHGAFLSAGDMVRMLFEEMEHYHGNSVPHDDRTLFCVKFRRALL